MTLSWAEIEAVVVGRRNQDFYLKRDMMTVRDRTNGDYVIPLYDVQGQPISPALSPQIVVNAIESGAQRAASTRPNIFCPAINSTDLHMKRADTRRRATYATWSDNQMWLTVRRAFRHLWGYGTTALWAYPDFERGGVCMELRDPLTAYPEPRAPEDVSPPDDVAFVYGRTAAWLIRHYPTAPDGRDLIPRWRMAEQAGQMIDVLEWIDHDVIVLGALGVAYNRRTTRGATPIMGDGVELERTPNRAGMVPAAVPCAVTLDRIASQVMRITGIADVLDRMVALNQVAAERAVFPDRYVLGAENGPPPALSGGSWKDGRSGDTNIVTNAKAIGELNSAQSQNAMQMISYLERAARMNGGDPAMFGGELTGSLRSGQTVNALGSFAIDPRVAEMQDILGAWLAVLNQGIVAVYKGYFGGRHFSMYSGRPGDTTLIDFTPNTDFETDSNVVAWAFPGSDVNAITVALGQAVGSQMMSRATARAKHPLVEEPDLEERSIVVEALRDALVQSIQTQVANPQMPMDPIDVAYALDRLNEGDNIETAIIKMHEAAQNRQATVAGQPQAGQIAAPETMPGIGGPASQQPPPPQAIPQPAQSVQNLRAMEVAYRNNTQQTPVPA